MRFGPQKFHWRELFGGNEIFATDQTLIVVFTVLPKCKLEAFLQYLHCTCEKLDVSREKQDVSPEKQDTSPQK